MNSEGEPGCARWHSTNLVGLPAGLLASTAFQAHPQPLHVAGVRETNAGLFALLDRSTEPDEAREIFAHYMRLSFGLFKADASTSGPAEARRWRTSYLKLLQGWGLDSNGPAGAVLKAWVESRYGLVPAFHKAPLQRFPSPAWIGYMEEKAAQRYQNNNVFQQLDLLFEFCQWMLQRHRLLGTEAPSVTLWRGSTRCEEQVVAGSLRERRCTMRLNNLVSFSLSRDDASCFGDWVLKAQVPLSKLLFVPGLINRFCLHGEGEVLAVGGDFEVEAHYEC